jgi:hypothetical protein
MTPLQQAFLEDHKVLTRGLATTLSALRQDDLEAATREADTLDQRAGPHIEFEERFFYPVVAQSRGAKFVEGLHREHDAGRNAIRTLLASHGTGTLSDDDRTLVLSQLREALDHAVSCGTLLSHVTTLAPERQQELLDHLLRLRREGPRWTKQVRRDLSRAG